jgi:hypothetical protein
VRDHINARHPGPPAQRRQNLFRNRTFRVEHHRRNARPRMRAQNRRIGHAAFNKQQRRYTPMINIEFVGISWRFEISGFRKKYAGRREAR